MTQEFRQQPNLTPLHLWECPSIPWQCIDLDFVGLLLGIMFLIAIDAHSKWLEVFSMKSTTPTQKTEVGLFA